MALTPNEAESFSPRAEIGLPTLEDIDLDPLSQREWRVIDKRLPELDAPCVLGFIERCGDTYDTLVIGHGLTRSTFPSLDEAKEHFTQDHGAIHAPE